MPRNPTHYTGATKRVTLAEARALGPRWVVQPKKDGIYARVYLDRNGRIARVFMRNGGEAPARLVSHLIGALAGAGYAEIVGELDAMTDAGEAAAKLGPRRIHLFDCLFDGVRSLAAEPYHVRRDALWRMQSEVQCRAPKDQHRPFPYGRHGLPGWKLTPIVEQVASSRAPWAWDAWVKEVDGEGLVAVALDASAGARCAKMKIKEAEVIDAVAVSVSRTTVTCSWNGHLFNVARHRHHVEAGEMVEVRHFGWESTVVMPRFASLLRVRRDLVLQ